MEVISEEGEPLMHREPTNCQNLLDLFRYNKPSLIKAWISISGILNRSIVLSDCDLKATTNMKPQSLNQIGN